MCGSRLSSAGSTAGPTVSRWATNSSRPPGFFSAEQRSSCPPKLESVLLIAMSGICKGELGPAGSSAVKVYGTECVIEVYRILLEILGPIGYLRPGSPGAALQGRVEQAARAAQINTFGGGVNEVQREIVAAAGLGMARRARQA